MPYMEDCPDSPLSRVVPLLRQRIMERPSYHGMPNVKSPLDFWIIRKSCGRRAGYRLQGVSF
jgi:hypothetical protein